MKRGHLGIKQTLDGVVSEFYWPRVCRCEKRFCKSLGSFLFMDSPFKRVAIDIHQTAKETQRLVKQNLIIYLFYKIVNGLVAMHRPDYI